VGGRFAGLAKAQFMVTEKMMEAEKASEIQPAM
jgi:hypothetical protein